MATCKLGEKGCWKDGKCHFSHDCENKVVTNADRIRAMSDEELARKLKGGGCPAIDHIRCGELNCIECWLEWLQQPAE